VIIRSTESFLTNPVLEALRKADQLESDVPDSPSNAMTKALLLYPIVQISNELDTAALCLQDPSPRCLADTDAVLTQNKYTPAAFKKTFNRYSDNIFYADSKRANVYLAGGTTPDSAQTSQYLYRNAILTSVQNAQGDVQGLLSSLPGAFPPSTSTTTATTTAASAAASDDEYAAWRRRLQQDLSDALSDVDEARQAMRQYLSLADPQDLEAARGLVSGPAPSSPRAP
jgi:hypothetical protein